MACAFTLKGGCRVGGSMRTPNPSYPLQSHDSDVATLRFPLIIEEGKDGFVIECPSFQGCYTQGDTYEAAMANIRDLIRLHLARGSVAAAMPILAVGSIEIEA